MRWKSPHHPNATKVRAFAPYLMLIAVLIVTRVRFLPPSRMAKRRVFPADAGLGIPWEIQRQPCPRVQTGFYLRHFQRVEL
jgi:hypothetical protein